MPTYGYECKSCGYTFDAIQSMRDDPLKTCPKCGRGIHRLISGGNGIIFKGKGFYVTDNNAHGDASKIGDTAAAGDSAKPASEKTAHTEASPCAGCPANSGNGKTDSGACPHKAAS